MLREGAMGLYGHQVADCAIAYELTGAPEGWMSGGDRTAAQGHSGLLAGPDHPVRFLEGMGHGLFGENPLRAMMYGETGEIGAMFGVRRDGHDIRPLNGQHIPGIVIEGGYAVSFPEGTQPFHIPVRRGDQRRPRAGP